MCKPMLRLQSMEFREQMRVDELTSTYTVPEVLDKYYVGGVSGFDKEGCLLWIDPFPLLDARGKHCCGSAQGLMIINN